MQKNVRPVILTAVMTALCLIVLIVQDAAAGMADQAVCDIQRGPCVRLTASGVSIELEIAPRPVRAMYLHEFLISLRKPGRPITGASVVLDLTMPGMFMGWNKLKLLPAADGRYRGQGIIARCPSGKRTWQAEVSIERAGRSEAVTFLFEVQ